MKNNNYIIKNLLVFLLYGAVISFVFIMTDNWIQKATENARSIYEIIDKVTYVTNSYEIRSCRPIDTTKYIKAMLIITGVSFFNYIYLILNSIFLHKKHDVEMHKHIKRSIDVKMQTTHFAHFFALLSIASIQYTMANYISYNTSVGAAYITLFLGLFCGLMSITRKNHILTFAGGASAKEQQDEDNWMGPFYFNPNDPSIYTTSAKMFKRGSFNFANPKTLLVLLGVAYAVYILTTINCY